MVLENVRLADGNACTDRTHSYVASCSYLGQSIIEVDKSSGVTQVTWLLDTLVSEVYSLEFDGFFWWTLEKQAGGSIVRKWRKYQSSIAKLENTFSFTTFGSSPDAMAVENYSTELDVSAFVGDYTLTVDDASNFRIGEEIVVGPSGAVGFVGNYDELEIVGISGNIISTSTPVTSNYAGGVAVYGTRAFWIFVAGELFKFNPRTGGVILSDTNLLYDNILAATFYVDSVLFSKANEIYWLNPNSLTVTKAMATDNLESDRSTILDLYDMYGYSGNIYRLQEQTSYLSDDVWYDTSWSTYNTVTSQVAAEVYMIALSSSALIMPALDPPAITTVSATITCQVFDQYFSPVASKVVDFTSDAGVVTPDQAITDTNGRCEIAYHGNAEIKLVTIEAETS
jgi:hypothetical protein